MTDRIPERRAERRDECAIGAKIEVGGRAPIVVALTDISPGGVRLRVVDGVPLPEVFDLLIPLLDDIEQRCRVATVWREDGRLGGRFIAIGELAADDHTVMDAMDAAIEGDRGQRRPARPASVKETGEEVPQEQWERFEAADKKQK